jgi:hypothetical protein
MYVGEREEKKRTYFILAALVVLAIGLRVLRLGDWGFEGDEIYTLRDSLHPRISNPRPLLYFLNYYLVRPLVPLNEVGLRILPVLFGVLAVPAFYFVVRRLVGSRAALFGALLLTLNHYQVYQSQNARYWSLVFLLTAVYPYAIYLGVRDRDPRQLALGLLTGALAVLAHPASIFLFGGLALFLATQLRGADLIRLWNHRRVRWATILGLVLAVPIGLRLVSILSEWIHVRPKLRLTDHLLHGPTTPGVKQIAIMLSYTDVLTVPLMLVGALGTYVLWQGRDRRLALLLMCLFIVPVAFIVLVSFRTSVGITYLIPSLPIFFIGAGVFLDELAGVEWRLRPRWLLSATVAVLIIAAGAPTLISQYRDGRRYDFRGAARWLDKRLSPDDVVLSDQYNVVTYYLPGTQVSRLAADTAALKETIRTLEETGRGGHLWIVAPYSAPRGSRQTTSNLGNMKRWIRHNCQFENAIGVARLDFRVKELHIFQCPSKTAAAISSDRGS